MWGCTWYPETSDTSRKTGECTSKKKKTSLKTFVAVSLLQRIKKSIKQLIDSNYLLFTKNQIKKVVTIK